MRDNPFDLEEALRDVGVDRFESEDAAFSCRSAIAHDKTTLERARLRVAGWADGSKQLLVVNLLACQDLHKCSWATEHPSLPAQVPLVAPDVWRAPGAGARPPPSRPPRAARAAAAADPPPPPGAHDGKRRLPRRRVAMHDDPRRDGLPCTPAPASPCGARRCSTTACAER